MMSWQRCRPFCSSEPSLGFLALVCQGAEEREISRPSNLEEARKDEHVDVPTHQPFPFGWTV